MDIRPVDMQLVINKAADVHKINDNPRQHLENQYNFADSFTKEANHESQKTVNLQKGEDQNISDGKGGKNKDSRRRNRKKANQQEESDKNVKSGSIFDVSI